MHSLTGTLHFVMSITNFMKRRSVILYSSIYTYEYGHVRGVLRKSKKTTIQSSYTNGSAKETIIFDTSGLIRCFAGISPEPTIFLIEVPLSSSLNSAP